MKEEVLYSIALAKVLPHDFGLQNVLIKEFGSAKSVYDNRNSMKDFLSHKSEKLLQVLASMDGQLQCAEREIVYAEKCGIECLTQSDARYPKRLRECVDSPILLFYKGTADLNAQRIISIVGTRNCTQYGRSFCHHFLKELSYLCPDVVVVSGLAYGIDVEAHSQALSNGIQTIGVLAHGMDRVYPRQHTDIARQMLGKGGLLTEYVSQTEIERLNFVIRNRIVAGVADAIIVVESKEKGGSLITARIANEYNRDVFAVPGRTNDEVSAGCNNLIRENRAMLLSSARDFVSQMRWNTEDAGKTHVQREIFPDLSPQEHQILKCLKGSDDGKDANQLCVETNIPITQLTSVLYELEAKGIVKLLCGGIYVVL